MTSIFENTSSPVTIHLLHDETLTQENREKFIRTAQKYSQKIEFHDVSDYERKYINEKVSSKFENVFTNGTFFRFFMCDVIELDKIIYLDCDVLVNMDIIKLWSIDPGDNYIAAAIDEGMQRISNHNYEYVRCLLIGCKLNTYVNSGVLVMNLKKLREREDFAAEAINWLSQHLHIAKCADQDAFNSLLKDSIMFLDGKFDRMIWNAYSDLSDSILHGCVREFNKIPPSMYSDRLYWYMFLRSAWGENVNRDELIDILAGLKNPNSARPKLSILRRILRRFKYEFKKLTDIPALVIRDMYYRTKYKFSR